MDLIENYILQGEKLHKDKLRLLRKTILEADSSITEKIAWGVPTYYCHGYLVQFAYCKNHIGFYCSPQAISHYQKELSIYKTNNKNAIHFPYHKDLPLSLIHDIVLYRIEENKSANY